MYVYIKDRETIKRNEIYSMLYIKKGSLNIKKQKRAAKWQPFLQHLLQIKYGLRGFLLQVIGWCIAFDTDFTWL